MSHTWRLLVGDVRERLAELPAASVHCVVTSPPYWGLRDYGVAGQLGLEATPEAYVATMVEVFRAVRRVLRDDGTLWLNMGDCYAGSWSGNSMRPEGGAQRAGGPGFQPLDERVPARNGVIPQGLKPKDLVGMPWRLAFALQADGWWLRSDIIWAKPNPMPESVTDRPTKAHEYLFLLAKSERYYYDAAAIREPASGTAHARGSGVNPKAAAVPSGWDTGPGRHTAKTGRYKTAQTPHRNGRRQAPEPGQPHSYSTMPRPKQNASFSAAVNELVDARNARTVWTIPTEPYAGAHFATFPRALVAPCIQAGCPVGGTVLDPFAGSGTTLCVALDHQRNALGIEVNAEYVALARARILHHAGLLAQEALT